MGLYNFKAQDVNKRIVRGRITAHSQQDIKEKLISKQLILVSANVVESKKGLGFSSGGGGKIKTKHLVIVTRQLSFLLNAGVPIVQALETAANNTEDVTARKIFTSISQTVESGKNFSGALKNYKNTFNTLYINMVKAGEEGGSLDVMLNQLSIYMEKTEKIKRKVKSAMMYPCFILFAATVMVLGIIYYLVPQFQAIFEKAGQELPGITQFIVNFSDLLRNHFILIFFGTGITVMAFSFLLKTPGGAKLFEQFISKVPALGGLFTKNSIARYSRTLSCLLSAGVGISDAINISGKASGSIMIGEASSRIALVIESGYSFGRAFSQEKIFPVLIKNMVAVGEETGSVDAVFAKVADFYEEQVEAAVEGVIKLIEPVLIVGVGGAIAFVLIALYLPIFKMSGTLAG